MPISKPALAIMLGALVPVAVPAKAQEQAPKPIYYRLASGAPALLYEPATLGPKSAIGILVMHASADYLTHSSCTELSKRGYRVMCANNSTSKSGVSDDGVLDKVLTEFKEGVVALRGVPGIKKVVLFGHSGGATITSAYQMIAENGVKSCQGPEKIHKCPDSLAGLPQADGIIFADANWGQATMVLFSIDPALISEGNAQKLNPALDMFNPANGFNKDGSHYSPAFIAKFLGAVSKRSTAMIKRAQDRLAMIEAGKGIYSDDEPFVVPGASFLGWNNKLFSSDTKLLSRSLKPWPLVHPDGPVTTEIIHSVRPPMANESATKSMLRGAIKTTVRNFLGTYAIRTTPAFGYRETSEITGVDWTSNYANGPGNAQSIRVPTLSLGMTGGWEGLAAETIHALSAAPDKSLAFIEGATHVYTTCKRCEKVPGQYGDTVKITYDYVDIWLAKPGRFLGN
jgi:hypothetical protein